MKEMKLWENYINGRIRVQRLGLFKDWNIKRVKGNVKQQNGSKIVKSRKSNTKQGYKWEDWKRGMKIGIHTGGLENRGVKIGIQMGRLEKGGIKMRGKIRKK